jgi:hypothetical protein
MVNNNFKIGILTFHDGINHGAFLQVYALQEFLISYNFDVEIINYKSAKHKKLEIEHFIFFKPYFNFNPIWFLKNTKRRLDNLRKVIKFKKCHKHLKITDYIDSIDKIQTEKYDVVITGSDEIWNYNNAICGFDTTYFGKGIKSKKLISYAASFGNVDTINSKLETISFLLKKYSKISVRDINSQAILKRLNISSELVLDPTLLYDRFKPKQVKESNYILVYLNHITSENILSIREFASKNKKTIITIGYHANWANISKVALDPFEWINYFYSADYIITNTYHGTIFSIIFRKLFLILNPGRKSNKINSLLENLNIKYLIKNELIECNFPPIDYEMVFRIIKDYREKSKYFLINAIHDNESKD